MCRDITEPGKMFIDMAAHIPRINEINAGAQRIGALVFFTTVAFHQNRTDAGTFGEKVPLIKSFLISSGVVKIDPRLIFKETDHLIVKIFPVLLRN